MSFEQSLIGRPNTVKTHKSLFRHHILPQINNCSVHNFTEKDLFKLYQSWKDLSPSTQKMLLSLFKRYMEWSNGPQLPYQKYSKLIGRSRQKEEPKALTKEQAHALQKEIKNDQKFYPAFLFGLHAGLRRGEVFGLQPGDIDLLKGIVHVKRSYSGPTKNGKSRIVPLSRELEDALLDININKKYKTSRLFSKIDPNPVLRYYCKKAKVPLISFHCLRHTFATLALEAGKSPKLVSQTLGHSNLSTTLDIYWSSTNEKLELDFL